MVGKKREEVNTGEWLNTYADMVTLLLTFFVLLYANSSVSAESWEMIVEALSDRQSDKMTQIVIETIEDNGVGYPAASTGGAEMAGQKGEDPVPQIPQEFEQLFEFLKEMIEKSVSNGTAAADSVDLVSGEGFVFIRFKDSAMFGPDSSVLLPSAVPLIDFVAGSLKNIGDDIKQIRIDGHTADVPGVENYAVSDRVLSTDRANAVLSRFDAAEVVSPDKMYATGWGKYRPIAPNDTSENRIRNRRVEIFIQKEDGSGDEITNIYELLDEIT